jgi:hypothetical protein
LLVGILARNGAVESGAVDRPIWRSSLRDSVDLSLDQLDCGFGSVDLVCPGTRLYWDRRAEITDRVTSGADLHVSSFTRSFARMSSRVQSSIVIDRQSVTARAALDSPLDGMKVLFTRSEDGEAFAASVAPDAPRIELPHMLLEELDSDLAFASVAPPDGAQEGDGWRIAPEELASLMLPGGALGAQSVSPGEIQDGMLEIARMASLGFDLSLRSAAFTGTSRCRLLDAHAGEAGDLQELRLSFDVRWNAELAERISRWAVEVNPVAFIHASLTLQRCKVQARWKGEGSVTWSAAAHRVTSLEIHGRLEIELDPAFELEWGDHTWDLECTIALSGYRDLELSAVELREQD